MRLRRRCLGYYEDVHQPLAPPPGASSERLLTTSTAESGNANRVTCEGAGGVYTEHCPSMAQIGVVGPYPTAPGVPAFQAPCVSYCEMPSGKQVSTQEDPYNRWQPTMPGMTGYGDATGALQTGAGLALGVVSGLLLYGVAMYVLSGGKSMPYWGRVSQGASLAALAVGAYGGYKIGGWVKGA